MQPIFSKKTTSPSLPPTILHRPSLTAALNEAAIGMSDTKNEKQWLYKLILLCAPAGYGKTTLLADFEEHTHIPCCWYFLDQTDANPGVFLEFLSASIRQRFPHYHSSPDISFSGTSTHEIDAQVDALVLTIKAHISERFTLIFCNYHEIIHNQEINSLINRLIQSLPQQCMLILESRAIPNLEFVPLLARREVFGLGSEELRFTTSELHSLAQSMGVKSLTAAEITQLDMFGGWITGILLGTRLGDLHPPLFKGLYSDSWKTAALHMEPQRLLAYLNDDVFAFWPEAYMFLKDAVVLQHMSPALCGEILAIPEADEHLRFLEQNGLFITRQSDDKDFYICHPAVRRLLFDELRNHAPDRFINLHRRAMEFFHSSQNYEQAIYHALEARIYDRATELIAGIYKPMLAQGNSAPVARWIDELPAEITMHDSRLLLARANIFLMTGVYDQVDCLLDKAQMVIQTHTGEASVSMAELLILRAAIRFQVGDYDSAQNLCRQALTRLPVDEVTLRTEAQLYLGVCAGQLDSFSACIAELQQALRLHNMNAQTRQTAKLHSLLANAYGMVGHHILSEHHRSYAISSWEYLNERWGKIDNLIGLGVTKQRQGLFLEANQVLTEALNAARSSPIYQRGMAYAYTSLGDLYQDQGNYQQALLSFEEGLTLTYQLKDAYLTSYTRCALAITYLLMGDVETAHLLASAIHQEVAESESEHKYEVILCKLTLGTVFLHQQHYHEAYNQLILAETLSNTAGLKRERLQAAIRAAFCLYAQGNHEMMKQRVKDALMQAIESGYKVLIQIELQRFPDLLLVIQHMPEISHIETSSLSKTSAVKDPIASIQVIPSTDHNMLRIQALGQPCIMLNNTPIRRWRMVRTMELCFFLLDAGRPVHKEQIIEALWPDVDNQNDQTLRSILCYLRKILGAACVIAHNGTYHLNMATVYGERIWYDVDIFQKHYATAQTALKEKNDTEAAQAFQKMLHLYQGDYVQSFYSDWCIPRRNELRRAYLDAHHQLGTIALRRQQFDESIHHWQQLLAIDNCLEEAHQGLILCYIHQGKQGLALRQYQYCVDLLRDELRATPSQAFYSLYKQLVSTVD